MKVVAEPLVAVSPTVALGLAASLATITLEPFARTVVAARFTLSTVVPVRATVNQVFPALNASSRVRSIREAPVIIRSHRFASAAAPVSFHADTGVAELSRTADDAPAPEEEKIC